MKFLATRTVRFAECDPAGIVFFPQYLVMLNSFVEQWFDEGLGIAYAGLIGARRTGLPTVRLEVDFTAISRHGDRITLAVQIEKLGRSSMTLQLNCHGGEGEAGELRFKARQVLVCTSLDTHRPQPLPDDVRSALLPYLQTPLAPTP
jgi:4-hydroxybenzoyl-CoA thioesterase